MVINIDAQATLTVSGVEATVEEKMPALLKSTRRMSVFMQSKRLEIEEVEARFPGLAMPSNRLLMDPSDVDVDI